MQVHFSREKQHFCVQRNENRFLDSPQVTGCNAASVASDPS